MIWKITADIHVWQFDCYATERMKVNAETYNEAIMKAKEIIESEGNKIDIDNIDAKPNED